MSTNKSYQRLTCCGSGHDCNLINSDVTEPCWGDVDIANCYSVMDTSHDEYACCGHIDGMQSGDMNYVQETPEYWKQRRQKEEAQEQRRKEMEERAKVTQPPSWRGPMGFDKILRYLPQESIYTINLKTPTLYGLDIDGISKLKEKLLNDTVPRYEIGYTHEPHHFFHDGIGTYVTEGQSLYFLRIDGTLTYGPFYSREDMSMAVIHEKLDDKVIDLNIIFPPDGIRYLHDGKLVSKEEFDKHVSDASNQGRAVG